MVTSVSADMVDVTNDDGSYTSYRLDKFRRSNQGTCINQRPLVAAGQQGRGGHAARRRPCTDGGEMALGRNLLVAFMPWEGHNYEDAIILSQRLVQDDVLTSIHIEEHEIDARDTKLGAEEITRDIPNVGEDMLADLDERGIIRIGAEVTYRRHPGRQGHARRARPSSPRRSGCCVPSSGRRPARCATPR